MFRYSFFLNFNAISQYFLHFFSSEKEKMRLKQRKKIILRWKRKWFQFVLVHKISIEKFFGSRFVSFGPTNRN